MLSTAIRDEAFHNLAARLPYKRRRVYQAILHLKPCTNGQIATYLKVPINQVTGRVTELKDLFLIKEIGSILSETGSRHTKWDTVDSWKERRGLIQKTIEGINIRIFDYERALEYGHYQVITGEIKNRIRELKTRRNNLTTLCEEQD